MTKNQKILMWSLIAVVIIIAIIYFMMPSPVASTTTVSTTTKPIVNTTAGPINKLPISAELLPGSTNRSPKPANTPTCIYVDTLGPNGTHYWSGVGRGCPSGGGRA